MEQQLNLQVRGFIRFLQQKTLDQDVLNQAIAEFSSMSVYELNRDILPSWAVEDVQQAARMMTNSTKTVSAEHAILVLRKVAEDYDANIGVNWDVVQAHISELESSGQIKLRRVQKHFKFRASRQRRCFRFRQ